VPRGNVLHTHLCPWQCTPPPPGAPAGSAAVTVYGENWTAEKQTITMATTFSEWVAGSDAHLTAEVLSALAPLVARLSQAVNLPAPTF
jgi:hypothetical protein